MKEYTLKSGFTVTPEWLNEKESQRLQEVEIAEFLGISRMYLWKIRKDLDCPKQTRVRPRSTVQSIEEKRAKRNAYMRKYMKNRKGYKQIWNPDTKKVEYEHRVVMAKKLGRPLEKGESVHHINGDIRDNRPENLEIHSSHSKHMKEHHPPIGRPGKRYEYKGRKLTIREWCDIYGMLPNTLRSRIRRWGSIKKALELDILSPGGLTDKGREEWQKGLR